MLLDKGFKSDCSRLGITIRSPPASRFESLLRQRHFQVSACKLTESQIARCALTLAPGTLDRPESPDQSAHQRRHSALTRRRHLEVRVGGTREDCGTFAQINCAFHCATAPLKWPILGAGAAPGSQPPVPPPAQGAPAFAGRFPGMR